MLNSRHPLVTATPFSSGSKSLHHWGRTFFRSYGANLQSSLTTVLSSALVFSTRPPESVCGTVTSTARHEDFLGSMGSITSRDSKESLVITSRRWMGKRICQPSPSTGLNRDVQHPADLPFSVPPSLKRHLGGAGILTCFPSSTPFGLDLGTD